jgi:hypothetical protein
LLDAFGNAAVAFHLARPSAFTGIGTDPLDQPTIRAGTPATVAPGGTSCKTTLPAPTLAV